VRNTLQEGVFGCEGDRANGVQVVVFFQPIMSPMHRIVALILVVKSIRVKSRVGLTGIYESEGVVIRPPLAQKSGYKVI
jgi:uncharacterized paraquat-inducible protein A